MSIDGTYGFVYCGAKALGIGAFTVTNGEFRGSDLGGVRYSGTAKENPDGTIKLALSFTVPPGVESVQGTSAQDTPYNRQFETIMPPDFGDGKPESLPLPPGEVTVMVKRIPDEFARAATEGFTLQIAQRLTTSMV